MKNVPVKSRWIKVISPTRRLTIENKDQFDPRHAYGEYLVKYQTRQSDKSTEWRTQDAEWVKELSKRPEPYRPWHEYIPRTTHQLKFLFYETYVEDVKPVNNTMADKLKSAGL